MQLGQNVGLIDNILLQLSPEQHAIGCVFVLHVKANNIPPAGVDQWDPMFVQQVKRVIMGGSTDQLHFVKRQVCDICRVFTEHCRT